MTPMIWALALRSSSIVRSSGLRVVFPGFHDDDRHIGQGADDDRIDDRQDREEIDQDGREPVLNDGR